MSKYEIVTQEDNLLRKKSKEVKKVNNIIQTVIENMFETMYESKGVGLAAPQVGILKRIITIDVGEGPIAMVNPEIIESSGEQLGEEGCLSCPGYYGEVNRANYVKVKGLDKNGEEIIIEAEGYLARAFQHEIDHLNGILFIDIAEYVEKED